VAFFRLQLWLTKGAFSPFFSFGASEEVKERFPAVFSSVPFLSWLVGTAQNGYGEAGDRRTGEREGGSEQKEQELQEAV